MEVKGLTSECDRVGEFPDAPTRRGLKHVRELIISLSQSYKVYLLFIIPMEEIFTVTINQTIQPELQKEIIRGMDLELNVLAYNCRITPNSIRIKEKVPFDCLLPFKINAEEKIV